MTLEQSRQRVEDVVGAVRRAWLLCDGLRMAGYGLAATMLWALATAGLDNLLILTAGQIKAAWAVLGLGVLAWAGLLAARLLVWRPCDDALAVMYEASRTGVENRLVNSVQFIRAGLVPADVLASAALIENAERLDPRGAGAAVDRRPLARSALAFGIALFLCAAYAATWPQMASNAVLRLMHPSLPPPHLLHTDIAVTPGNAEIVEGNDATISATLSGHIPDKVRVSYKVGDGAWITEDMAPVGPGAYRFEGLRTLTMPVVYRVRAGKTSGSDHTLSIRYRPHVKGLQLTVRWPSYAGGKVIAVEPNRGDVTALEGSEVTVRVTADRPLKGGVLTLGSGVEVVCGLDPAERNVVTGMIPLNREETYRIGLTGDDGLGGAGRERYTLTPIADQAPSVSVVQPARDLVLPADASIGVTIEGRDDIGLRKMALQTRMGDGEWTDMKQWDLSGPEIREKSVTHTISLAALKVKPDQTLLYRAAAADGRAPVANRSVSRIWAISITAAAGEGKSLAVAQQRRVFDMIEDVIRLQRENMELLEKGENRTLVRTRQQDVRDRTLGAIAAEEQGARPNAKLIELLRTVADGEMLLAQQSARKYADAPSRENQEALKALMERVLARIQSILREAASVPGAGDAAPGAVDRLSKAEREEMVQEILAEMEKIEKFVKQQQQVIDDVTRIAKTPDGLKPEDADRLNDLKQVEDGWAKVFKEGMKGMEKLAMQDLADNSIVKDYKNLVADVEKAEEAMESLVKPQKGATSKAGEFKFLSDALLKSVNDAVKAQKKLEQALSADTQEGEQAVQDESAMQKEIDATDMPEELYDLAGELAEDSAPLQATEEQEKEVANYWKELGVDAKKNPEWAVDDGPTSDFGAKGVTGDKLPDDNVLSGRSGDGREGRAKGQSVDSVSKGLQGRQPPSSLSNDPYEEGVIKQLREVKTGGGTGGGKASGAGEKGLQGEAPAPDLKGLTFLKDWQKKMSESKARAAEPLKALRIGVPYDSVEFARIMELFSEASKREGDNRYKEESPREDMVLPRIDPAPSAESKGAFRHVQPAYPVPDDQRRQVVDAMKEPIPEEYREAQKRYFEQLSEKGR